jgi:citronellol/citronellal dehydrogenase
MSLAGKTLFITGASRGIGKAIALRAARDGANVAIVAKTEQPHPKLPGTIYSAAEEIEAAGGRTLPIPVDIRDDTKVAEAVKRCTEHFGGIDIQVNNASAISLTGTLETPMKRFDPMFGVNVRGTYCCSQACIPYLKQSANARRNPHILNLSPPLNLNPKWFKHHTAYTMSKYGMSMCARHGGGVSRRRHRGERTLAANGHSHRRIGDDPRRRSNRCRTPEILADAAYIILNRDSRKHTGSLYIDEEVLATEGVIDLARYAVMPGTKNLLPDLFVD